MIFFIISFAAISLYSLVFLPGVTDKFKEHPIFFVMPLLAFLAVANVPKYSVTIYNAESSQKSLGIMLTIVVIGALLLAAYFLFLYKTFHGKVKLDDTSY